MFAKWIDEDVRFGFYLSDPGDGVEITQDYWTDLLNGQSDGKIISRGDDGSPVLTDRVQTAEETLAANQNTQSILQAAASQAMTPLLMSLQLGDATDAETASAKAWQAYSRSLKAMDLTITDPAWPVVPA